MPSQLNISKSGATAELTEHRDEGNKLLAEGQAVAKMDVYESWRRRRRQWRDVTREALAFVYVGTGEAEEFESSATSAHSMVGGSDDARELKYEIKALERGIDKLESFVAQLRYAHEPPSAASAKAGASASAAPVTTGDGKPVIFLVHGHDEGLRETVARFLEKKGPADVDVVILEERPNKGRTVVEKLEAHASGSRYAVVLLTADDFGRAKDDPNEHPRGRQNVIFEFGWFCGLVGRENVAVLHEPSVELPSDLAGLVYIGLDTDWRTKLADELRESGIQLKS